VDINLSPHSLSLNIPYAIMFRGQKTPQER